MVMNQQHEPLYAVYNGDSAEVLPMIPDESVHLSIYSPPFAMESGGALYHYSSSPRDLSNCPTYKDFFEHYEYLLREIYRITLPGRMTVVHCCDVPSGNTGTDHYADFPGEIIRAHERVGFHQASPRITVWKEPLMVRNRTLTKSLAHRSIVEDSCDCAVAGADYLLVFRKNGTNPIPVVHPSGLTRYAGEREVPHDLHRYKGWTGNQIQNRYSHWIWRQYASCVWDDIRGNTGNRASGPGVLPYREGKDEQDEKHVHPLQLDVIERCVTLWTNPGEVVLTPFAGVGSEVYGAVVNGRKGVGIELKPAYYRQMLKNLATAQPYGEGDDAASMRFEWQDAEEEVAVEE